MEISFEFEENPVVSSVGTVVNSFEPSGYPITVDAFCGFAVIVEWVVVSETKVYDEIATKVNRQLVVLEYRS